MYSRGTGIIFGFHGCDKSVADKVINLKEPLNQSINDYDWLGHGIYFWENSPARALEFATLLKEKSNSKINDPCVIGAVIQLGNCLDLLDYEKLTVLKYGYEILRTALESQNKPLPKNISKGNLKDLLLRQLDCAVIQTLHKARQDENMPMFDSVRGVFWEGQELYPNAGFREKDHIQICVRNPNCIKGFFYPREIEKKYSTI